MRLTATETLSLYGRAARNAAGLVGAASRPPAILWVLTQRCFYECAHCESWLDTRPIDADALLRTADMVAASGAGFVALSGGEPFVVKRLREIVERLKRARQIVSINTNGHLLAEHADWLVESGVDHLQISVDGATAATHDAIRHRSGSFELILRGIERVRTLRRGARPQLAVCAVLMPANLDELGAWADRFAAVADEIEFQPLHDVPGLLAPSEGMAFTAADRARVEAVIAAVAARHPAFATPYYARMPRYLFERDTLEPTATDHCLPRIFNTLTIREDGAYYVCQYPLGATVAETSIVDVWNAPARRVLHRRLAADGCGSPCWLRCYSHASPTPGRLLRRVLRAGGPVARQSARP